MTRWRLAHALLLVLALVGGCSLKTKGKELQIAASGRPPREIYAHGEKMMKRGLFDKALEDFQELRNFHRDDPLSVRAELAIAEIRFRKGDYDEARYAFQEFEDYHPNFAPDYVSYMVGYTIWKVAPRVVGRDQTLTRQAVNEWTGFGQLYPDSEYRDEVDKLLQRGIDRLASKEMFVARFYRKRRAWAAVEGRSARLLQLFPSSRYAEEALALLSEGYHRVGRVEDAKLARERLVAMYPDSGRVRHVDHVLALPPGTPPEDVIFARPYRLPGYGLGGQAPQ
ncbi:MAG: outer membrane protein assembly factor BamD [Alphaproteobacteria bacterium]|nr:outer membrane protein assembly factor BamD [Alphaproteobacteria bacterium]